MLCLHRDRMAHLLLSPCYRCLSLLFSDALTERPVTPYMTNKGKPASVPIETAYGRGRPVLTISGLVAARSGDILFLGERINGIPPHKIAKRGISHCPEDSGDSRAWRHGPARRAKMPAWRRPLQTGRMSSGSEKSPCRGTRKTSFRSTR